MKLNKYIFAALITSTTLFLGSCSDFLDRSPQGQFTEDDNPNALVNGKIYNVYTMMRNYNVTAGPPAFAIHCFRSEDSEKGSIASDGSDVAEMYDDFVYTPVSYTHLTSTLLHRSHHIRQSSHSSKHCLHAGRNSFLLLTCHPPF